MHVRFWTDPRPKRAVEWDFARVGTLGAGDSRLALAIVALLVAALLLPAARIGQAADRLVSVIVREATWADDQPERLVEASGGSVGTRLPIINGFAAEVPASAVGPLTADPSIEAITPNARVELQGGSDTTSGDIGSLEMTVRIIGADRYWSEGIFGRRVDVAIVDSGVSPVLGLDAPAKVVRGPDLSFESQAPNLRYLDSFGHGTFMAGLIAGDDPGPRREHRNDDLDGDGRRGEELSATGYSGIAPAARIVSVKVANALGVTDVSQVIAAIDWVVQHRFDNGLNIRVLNLSFGTYGTQPYTLDPLAFAAEVAWHRGIFVVVAAGNASDSGRLMNPAIDPFVMAVGASDPNGTLSTVDDSLLAFSARGDGTRNPDLVAPGRSLQGLRVPGSYIDLTFPGGRLSDRYFRGSGTSQAAAIVSGAAALVIEQRPQITPDQLKALLVSTAQPLPAADPRGQGAGVINLQAAYRTPTPLSVQGWTRSAGTGSLEAARGSNHVVLDGVALQGEQDIFAAPFDSVAMMAPTLTATTWSGGTWNGSVWTGPGWSGNEWSSITWSSPSWTGNEWSSNTWSGNEWSGNEWSANEWSANEWSANEWSANEWSANEWSSHSWATAEWR